MAEPRSAEFQPTESRSAGPRTAADRVASALDDALYHLRRDCQPCAERYFDRARRSGATEAQIAAVRAAAGIPAQRWLADRADG